jgi:hypothetical protein
MLVERRNIPTIFKKNGRGYTFLLSEPIKRTVSQIDTDQFNAFVKENNPTFTVKTNSFF